MDQKHATHSKSCIYRFRTPSPSIVDVFTSMRSSCRAQASRKRSQHCIIIEYRNAQINENRYIRIDTHRTPPYAAVRPLYGLPK